jgi:hypothetical protein
MLSSVAADLRLVFPCHLPLVCAFSRSLVCFFFFFNVFVPCAFTYAALVRVRFYQGLGTLKDSVVAPFDGRTTISFLASIPSNR